jgi:solute:Na+ symporter, SSS family
MLKLIVVVLYVAVMLLVGYLCMRKTRTVSDFFLGGRSLGPWLSAFAYGTTYFSAVLFIGYAGKLGWGFGLHTMWIVVGNAFVGCFLAWRILGGRTRAMTGRLNAMTMPEFLAARYDSQFLKLVAALVIFCFLVPYSASVYTGLSLLFQKNMDIPYGTALAFMAVLTGVYLMMGGYFALVWTDLIRGILEIAGVVIMVVYLTSQQGGFISATGKLMNPDFAPGLKAAPGIPGWLTLLSLVMITSFGPWALPQMVQKFYSIKSQRDIRATMIVAAIFAIVMAFGAYFTGALTHLFYAKPPGKIDELMPTFLTEHTPQWVSLIILLLVFSASMSSLSSLVLVSSSAIAMDLYGGIINRKCDKKTIMLMMRLLCGVFVAVSLYIALKKPTTIVNLMVISWGALSGSFLAPYVYGLFWKRATKTAAIVSMFSGLAISVGLYVKWGEKGIPLAGAIAMVTPVVIMPIVSLLTTPPHQDLIDAAFKPQTSEASGIDG